MPKEASGLQEGSPGAGEGQRGTGSRGPYGATATGHQDSQARSGGRRPGAQWVTRPQTSRAGGEGAHPGRGGDAQSRGPTGIRVWVG